MTTRNHQGFPAQPGAAPDAELDADSEDERDLPGPEDPEDDDDELPF